MSLTDLAALAAYISPGLIALLLALSLLVWLYVHSAAQLRNSRQQRLNELQESLRIYGRLAGCLQTNIQNSSTEKQQQPNELIHALQETKAAPYLTPHLQEQVQSSLRECDASRSELLLKSLEREMNKLIEERRLVLLESHAPGWGTALWKLLRPAAGPLALAGIVWLISRLLVDLTSYSNMDSSLANSEPSAYWLIGCTWMRFASGLIALLYVYRLMTLRKQNDLDVTASHFPTSLLSIVMAAVALFQWIGPEAAPYILAAQFVLFLIGFWITRGRSRSDRPYVGQPGLMKADSPHPAGHATGKGRTSDSSFAEEHIRS
ncbi:flagellar export protein FliJ [Paenibacillus farraposensis]|uniref:Flagellar export protein FliJ n=1 Tax=Paenibacillus farraposensis TaxID=2807095 RepID=A0ABW4DAJ3_9BACL|nr:flagellar export protein FliJ [Paenibacillus farraposensis]MCC3379005.1 flagellar FliJ family protein [Paenibacillus farraposensis]